MLGEKKKKKLVIYEVSSAFMRKWFQWTLAFLTHRLPTTSLNIKTHLTHFVLHCNSPPRVVIQSIKQSFFILLSIYLHLSTFFFVLSGNQQTQRSVQNLLQLNRTEHSKNAGDHFYLLLNYKWPWYLQYRCHCMKTFWLWQMESDSSKMTCTLTSGQT